MLNLYYPPVTNIVAEVKLIIGKTDSFFFQIQIRQGERLTHPIPESKVEMYEYELEPGPSNTSQLMKSHAASTRPIPIPRQIIEKSMDIAEEISEGTIT